MSPICRIFKKLAPRLILAVSRNVHVCVVCCMLSPTHATYFEASHWPTQVTWSVPWRLIGLFLKSDISQVFWIPVLCKYLVPSAKLTFVLIVKERREEKNKNKRKKSQNFDSSNVAKLREEFKFEKVLKQTKTEILWIVKQQLRYNIIINIYMC